jgi:hypothetical protein
VLDGGLVVTLVIYGIAPVHAAAAVLVYHAIAFWVPGLGGLLGLAMLRRELSAEGVSNGDPPLRPSGPPPREPSSGRTPAERG